MTSRGCSPLRNGDGDVATAAAVVNLGDWIAASLRRRDGDLAADSSNSTSLERRSLWLEDATRVARGVSARVVADESVGEAAGVDSFVVALENAAAAGIGIVDADGRGEEEKKDRDAVAPPADGVIGGAGRSASASPSVLDVLWSADANVRRLAVKNNATSGGGGDGDAEQRLSALGDVLFEVFAGRPPSSSGEDDDESGDEGDVRAKRTKRLSGSVAACLSPRDELIGLGLPSNLCDLVSSAIDPAVGECRYDSVGQVEEDLALMLSHPEKYLRDRDVDADLCDGALLFPDAEDERLYGRAGQIEALMGAYDRAASVGRGGRRGSGETVASGAQPVPPVRPGRPAPPEIVLLSGQPGSGKSALARHAARLFSQKGARCASGKFDEVRRAEPLSGLAAAFGELCERILKDGTEEETNVLGDAVREALGSESRVLIDVIPALAGLIGSEATSDVASLPPRSTAAQGKAARHRLRFLCRKLVRTIASRRHPLVLFLDDLHWADDESLELLAFLATDPTRPPLLLIGACRDGAVAGAGGTASPARKLQEIVKRGASIVEIRVDALHAKACLEAVSDVLLVLPRLAHSLADEVHHKTGGNPLFVRQFLSSLVDDGALHFNLRTRRWEWNLDSVRDRDVEDDIVALLTVKILTLPGDVQRALRVASCFGSRCDESTLRLLEALEGGACCGLVASLDAAVKEGLMVKMSSGSCALTASASSSSSYKFSHDQIRNAAHSLIPQGERESLHLELGRFLAAAAALAGGKGSLDFVVVDLMNRGAALIVHPEERVGLARLNLRVGKRMEVSSSFAAAAAYFLRGMILLGVDGGGGDWADHPQYDLTLELVQSRAEALVVTGDFASATSLLESVFANAASFRDTVRAYHALIGLLGAQYRIVDATATGFRALATLGEAFPDVDDVTREVVQEDLRVTMDALEGTTLEAIQTMDEMPTKSEKRTVMRFLAQMCRYSYVANQSLFALLCFRMVRTTLEHGVCEQSCGAFASLAVILNRVSGTPRSAKFGKLALALTERLNARRVMPNVYAMVYGCLFIFFEPLQAVTDKLREGYEVGLLTGDVESAMGCLNFSFGLRLLNGYDLNTLLDEMRVAVVTMKQCGQRFQLFFTSVQLQCAMNLVGLPKGGDPTVLTGEEEIINTGRKQKNVTIQLVLLLYRMWLAYYFRRYRQAGEWAIVRRNLTNERPGMLRSNGTMHETLYTGLIAAEVARADDSGEWRGVVLESIASLEQWSELCPWNFRHKALLLNAELARVDGEDERAAMGYDEAIATAKSHRFVHEEALACERAAMFSSELGNRITARDYFVQAHELYLRWGARAKAADVLEQISQLDVRN